MLVVTSTGDTAGSPVPLPSWPALSWPQHWMWYWSSSPHPCCWPSDTECHDADDAIGTSTLRDVRSPTPSWPKKLLPPQLAEPVDMPVGMPTTHVPVWP